jgi:serine/threonine protein kinase
MGNKEEVKVFDFGSKFDINDLDFPAKKARYLSPEQCAVSGKPDTRSDIYSLGVIMFELLPEVRRLTPKVQRICCSST